MEKSKITKDKADLMKTIARFDKNGKITVEDITDSSKTKNRSKPHTLLVQVLLEQVCGYFEKDEKRKLLLFNEINKRLGQSSFVDPSLALDSLTFLRQDLAKKFHQYVEKIHKQMPIPPIQNGISFGVYPEDWQEIHVQNKYNQTFQELGIIAKGGFGVVCKARHKVDDVIYAVKKIIFKYKNDFEFCKVLREAKSIAALKHTNIVSYNNAWIDVNLPMADTENSSGSSSKNSSEDSSSQNESTSVSSDENCSQYCESLNTILEEDSVLNHSVDSIVFEDEYVAEKLHQRTPLNQIYRTEQLGLAKLLSENVEENVEENESFFDEISVRNKNQSSSGNAQYLVPHQKRGLFSNVCETNCSAIQISGVTKINDICLQKTSPNVSKYKTLTLENSPTKTSICKETSPTKVSGIRWNIKSESQKKFALERVNRSQNCSSKSELLLPNLQNRIWNLENLNVKSMLCIQMEYCDCDLRDWLDQRAMGLPLPVDMDVMNIFIQILYGVAHIHFKSIIHRDLKPKNIFFSKENGVVKIGDFGLATLACCSAEEYSTSEICDNFSAGLGTIPYAAPEQRRKTNYDHKVDIYSLGIILIELLHNFQTKMEFFIAVEEILKQTFPPDIVENYPDHVDLIKKLIKINPKERLSAKEILQLPLLNYKKPENEDYDLSTYENIIKDLRQKVLQSDEEIRQLKMMLIEKEAIINHQTAELARK